MKCVKFHFKLPSGCLKMANYLEGYFFAALCTFTAGSKQYGACYY